MYSENDLDSAIAAGVLSAVDASALRDYVSSQRATPIVDEENFRLLTGFNDIFVAIAGVLLLIGAGWIGGEAHPVFGAVAVAALSWGLSEYFTRTRRMALPSIIFLLAFVSGVFGAVMSTLYRDGLISSVNQGVALACAAAVAAAAAYAHWRRFAVPITIAAGTASGAAVIIGLIQAIAPNLAIDFNPILLIIGIMIFALAMYWDVQDRTRTTHKSDVAFWLHLLAAPLIAHPIFAMLGLLDGGGSITTALIVVALYIMMGVVALAVDRRAILVSALVYVIAAIILLLREFGAVSLNVALAIFVIGSALLLLSAFWQNARALVVGILPDGVRMRLPNINRVVAT